MRTRHMFLFLAVSLSLLVGTVGSADDKRIGSREALHLTIGQKDFLRLEPILATVRVESDRVEGLPPAPGEHKQLGTLRFEIEPAVKLRKGAKPLPLEGTADAPLAQSRDFDLFEWFEFPEVGSWTVRAVVEHKGATLTSPTVKFVITKPGKDDPEQPAMARIHHTPWSNYDTDAFCGDTFDLVQKWPESRYAKYCHYWNGRYSQNKKEYEKAIASFRIVVDKYPDFALADDADYGIVECLCAQKKFQEAEKYNTALRQRLKERKARAGIGSGQTMVQGLAHAMSHRLNRELRQN